MARTFVSKTTRCQTPEHIIFCAVDAVIKGNQTIWSVAKEYGISLRDFGLLCEEEAE